MNASDNYFGEFGSGSVWVPQVGVLADLWLTASLRGTGLGVPRPVAPINFKLTHCREFA